MRLRLLTPQFALVHFRAFWPARHDARPYLDTRSVNQPCCRLTHFVHRSDTLGPEHATGVVMPQCEHMIETGRVNPLSFPGNSLSPCYDRLRATSVCASAARGGQHEEKAEKTPAKTHSSQAVRKVHAWAVFSCRRHSDRAEKETHGPSQGSAKESPSAHQEEVDLDHEVSAAEARATGRVGCGPRQMGTQTRPAGWIFGFREAERHQTASRQ